MTWSNFTAAKSSPRARAAQEIALHEFEGLGERLEGTDIGALELRVVEIIELVEGPDGMAVVQEAFAHVRADEARAAGDEKVHGARLNRCGEGVERRGVH